MLRHNFPKRILKILYMYHIFVTLITATLYGVVLARIILDPLYLLQNKVVGIVNNSEYLAHTYHLEF